MLIQTTRFGMVDVDEARIITFPDGLLGFPRHQRFALIKTGADPVFFWMQSVDDATIAFVVCDPLTFVPDYQVPIRKDDLEALDMGDVQDSQVLIIANAVGDELTGNLLGPLVIGVTSRRARQFVLSDKRYGTRQRLIGRRAALARTA